MWLIWEITEHWNAVLILSLRNSDNFQSTGPYSAVGRIAVCSLLNKWLDSCSSFHPNLISVLFLFYGNAYGTITKMDWIKSIPLCIMTYTNIGKFRDATKVFPPRIREDTGNEIVPWLDCSMMASFFSKIFCLTRKPWFSFLKNYPTTIPQL